MVSSTHAADWAFSPSISISERYDSNINFSFQNQEDDFITYVTPVFTITGETEKSKFRSDSTVTLEKYFKHTRYDDIEYDFNNVLSHQLTERFSAEAGAHFAKDTTLDTQLDQSGLSAERADRFLFDFGLEEKYAISERLTASVSEGGGTVLYPDGQFPDTSSWRLGSDLGYLLTPRDTLHLSLSYWTTDYTYTSEEVLPVEASLTSTLQEIILWERAMSETTSLRLGVGYRMTWTESFRRTLELDPDFGLRSIKEKVDNQDGGLVFLSALEKVWSERFSTEFSAGKEQYSSADGQSFDHTYGAVTLKYAISEVTTANGTLRFDHNVAGGGSDEERDYLKFAPSIERRLSTNLSLKLAGSYEKQLRNTSGFEQDGDRHQVWVQLTYRLPRFLTNR